MKPPMVAGRNANPVIDIHDIARRFGRTWVLRGISLHVQAGELVALTGPNGSGKTTLLRIVATALRPTRGGGRILGHDLAEERNAIRSRIGYLGHSAGAYADLTAAENLTFAQRMATGRQDPRAVEAALDEVGLDRSTETRVREFSAGMLRRLGLARLILQNAELLLLDEPHASLDTESAARLDLLLRRCLERGGSILVATHDARRLEPITNRTLRLEHGRAHVIPDQRAGRSRRGREPGFSSAPERTPEGVA